MKNRLPTGAQGEQACCGLGGDLLEAEQLGCEVVLITEMHQTLRQVRWQIRLGGDLLLFVQNYPLVYTFYELTPPSHRPRRSPTSNTPEPRVVADILDADRLAEVSWLLTDVRRCEGSSLAQYRRRLNIIVHREANRVFACGRSITCFSLPHGRN